MNISRKVAVGSGLLIVLVVIFAGIAVLQASNTNSCPPTLHADNSSGTNATIVEYEDLSDRRQAEFTDALQSETFPEVNTTYDAWVNTSHVRYRGEIYSTAVAVC